MHEKRIRLEYLPRFHADLAEAVIYISETLQNPSAAEHLADAVKEAILERVPYAEAFEPYHSKYEHRYPYYRIYVGNYIIYYVVIDLESERIMQLSRFLHVRQNRRTIV